MRLNKKILIIPLLFFFAFMHNVKAIYLSSAGTSYNGSQGSCGNSKNCKNGNYFIMQARLYYIDNNNFVQIGKTYYFVSSSAYNYLNGKGLDLEKITAFDGYTPNANGYKTGFNYLNNTYFNDANQAKEFLNKITNTSDYNMLLTKTSQDKGGTKGYRIVIEPADNYANPTFSSENAGLITNKGIASELIRLSPEIPFTEPYKLLGADSAAQYLYVDSKDVGIAAQSRDKCERLDAEQFGDMKYGCGYNLIDINKYIIPAKCYVESGVNTKNGGLKCINYDENNTEEYTTKYVEASCNGKTESQKLQILKSYGKLAAGTNACGIYCNEEAEVSFPGNVLTPILQGSYFAWPTRYDDINGKYSMVIKTKLTCHTIGAEVENISSTYERYCESGYTEYKGTINGHQIDLCRKTSKTNKICPSSHPVAHGDICIKSTDTAKTACPANYVSYNDNTCRHKNETAKTACPSGYGTSVNNTYCRNNTKKNKVCPNGYPNVYNNKCYKACPNGYTFKNGECRKPINLTCSSSQYTSGTSCYDKASKSCESEYTATGQAGNAACRKYVRTDYSCSSGYTMQSNDTTAYCCTGSTSGYCYSKGVCSGSYVSKSLSSRYCWKYRGDSSSYYHCDSGYAKWDSAGNTCWKCTQHMYTRWETHSDWEGPWGETSNINNAWYCGTWYQTTGRTASCPQNYKPSGGSCVRYTYTYNENATTCASKGGSFVNQDRNGKVTWNGTGTCKFTSWKSMQYTTTHSWYYTEGGWVQGTARWEWEYKAPNATNVYDYQPVKCPSGYPTEINSTTCRSNTGSNPTVCDGEEINKKCYAKNKTTPKSTSKVCPSGTQDVGGTCYQVKEKICDSSTTVTINGKCYTKTGKICDSSTTVTVNGKCYEKTTEKVCDVSTVKNGRCYREVAGNSGELVTTEYTNNRKCPAGTVERDGKCYKQMTTTAGVKVTQKKDYTSTRVCPTGFPNEGSDGKCYAACESGYSFIKSINQCGKEKDFECLQNDSDPDVVRKKVTVEKGTYCFRTKKKTCIANDACAVHTKKSDCKGSCVWNSDKKACTDQNGWSCNNTSGVACTGSRACRKVKTSTSTTKTKCDAGYNKEDISGTYCCKSNNCYTPASGENCQTGYSKKKIESGSYCWKYTDSYACDSGYALWTSDDNSCWKCTQTGYDNYNNVTTNQNNMYYCGYYQTITNSSSYYTCPMGDVTYYGGTKCVVKGVARAWCAGKGGHFAQNSRDYNNGGTDISSGIVDLGNCYFDNAVYHSTSSSYRIWNEDGWVEGTSHRVWTYKKASSSTTNATTYSYKAKKCPPGFPTTVPGQSSYCRESGPGSGKELDCTGTKVGNKCYDVKTPTSSQKNACPSTHPNSDSSGCYRMVNITPYCSDGVMNSAGNCVKCSDTSYTFNKTTNYCEKQVAKDACPDSHPFKDSKGCYRNLARSEHWCRTGVYVDFTDKCVICTTAQRVTREGYCRYSYSCPYPKTVPTGGECYETTPKITRWTCPPTYDLDGTTCKNSCTKAGLTSALKSELGKNTSAKLKAGTNKAIDDELVPTTTKTYNDAALIYNSITTFKINPNTNRYFNKTTSEVSNTSSGWNSKYVFDRKEGVVSLSLNDPITKNGKVINYPLEITDVHFGTTYNYGQHITDYKCTYKITNNSCICPSGTDFAGVSVFDLTNNICNITSGDNTCADLQYKICNVPTKYTCKTESGGTIDLTSCVNNEIHNGSKPYNAFLKCRANNSSCTKVCKLACTGNCVEEDKEISNVRINITRCNGKICNIMPYCKSDKAVVSNSSIECIAQKLNLKGEEELKKKIDDGTINTSQLLGATNACESTICGKQKILFRLIDLGDPFYGNNSRTISDLSLNGNKARRPGSNWNSKDVVVAKILKSRGVNGKKLYTKKPLYTITLTPKATEAIRNYNKTHSYKTFDVHCDGSDKTYGCVSDFLHGDSDSLKSLKVSVSGVDKCVNLNLSSGYEQFKKCYETNN